MIEIECPVCKKNFQTYPYKLKRNNTYCSSECRIEATKKRIQMVCPQCGNAFETTPCKVRVSKTGVFFCRQECRRAWQKGQIETMGCHFCGKLTTRRKSDIKERQGKFFCGIVCFDKWKETLKVDVSCKECGKRFLRYKHHSNAYDNEFCSMACLGIWNGRRLRGENNPRWKGGRKRYYGPDWKRRSKEARNRDGYKCCYCGKRQKSIGRKVDVHHIIPFREFGYIEGENENYKDANKLSNLISLCPSCHQLAENGRIPIRPNLI